ncbi:MAG TPA: nitronate monooxygenase family protein [Thermodesulfobacteriota bacterium]|nr:nitronate monooxygenase family protein [Thermodesulfobacteriota bacterium]
MLKTRMTELLGIEYPIQCGTMMALSKPELVSAVANAGGLACLAAAIYPTQETLTEAIEKTKSLTSKPFGVNVSLFPALVPRPVEEMLETIIKAGVKILETAGRSPQPYREMITQAGLIHIHKCARVRDAVKADGMGVDIVSIVGTECGGHPSMEKVTSLVLIPKAAAQIKAPLIAGGGFGNGKTLLAALAMGAEGINMGTRFLATQECPLHPAAKAKVLEAGEADTVLVMESLMNPARVLRTEWVDKILEMEKRNASLEELAPMISGRVSFKGWESGDLSEGIYPMGQVIGLIDDIPTVAELMKRTVAEALETKKRLDGLM